MSGRTAQANRVRIGDVLRGALRSFAAFPGPGLLFFTVLTGWNCYDGTGSESSIASPPLILTDPWTLDTALWLAGSLLLGWLMCGLARVSIAGVRGQASTWNDTVVSLSEYFHAATALGTWVTLGLLGLLLLVVPGIVALLAWSQAFYCAIDCKESWTAAMKHSRAITRRHYLQIAGASMAMSVLLLPGGLLSLSASYGSALAFATGEASADVSAKTAVTLMLLGATLGAAASTATSYIGAALYVALQDAFVAGQAAGSPDGAGKILHG